MTTQSKPADLFDGLEKFELLYHPEAISLFIERHYAKHHVLFEEKRSHPRYPLTIQVEVCPVNERLERQEELFKAVTRDISVGGLCLLHTRWIKSKFLAVKLAPSDGEPTVMVLKITRNLPIGSFYEIAGKFVTRLMS